MKSLLILSLALVLIACGSSRQPEWMTTASEDYNEQQYLTAVGEGETRQEAADRALANLAKVFEVSIAEQTLDVTRATSQETGSGRQGSAQTKVTRYISVEARQQLSGARVVEYWQNKQGRQFALAALEKAPAARRFRNDISQADQQVQALVDYASQTAPNPVRATSALVQARRYQWQRENLNRNLMVVAQRGVPSPYTSARIDTLIRDGLADLRFAVAADSPEFEQLLKGAMGQMGIRVSEESNLVLSGRMDTGPVIYKEQWYWVRGAYQLSLSDQGNTLATKRWPLKVSAGDEGTARLRARNEVVERLPDYLMDLLAAE